jgi:AcrR family transcriptional regulator
VARVKSSPKRRPAAPAPPSTPEAGTRARVLQVARTMIARRGNAAISLVDVAAEAGLSRQALYLLFGSRSGLLLAVVDDLDDSSQLPSRLAALRLGLPAQDSFEPYLRTWFEYIPVVLPVARALLAAAATGDVDAQHAWDSRMQKLRGGYLQLAKGLKAAGLLREGWTVEAAADWIFAQTHVDLWQHLVVESGWKPPTAVSRIVTGLRETLLKPD